MGKICSFCDQTIKIGRGSLFKQYPGYVEAYICDDCRSIVIGKYYPKIKNLMNSYIQPDFRELIANFREDFPNGDKECIDDQIIELIKQAAITDQYKILSTLEDLPVPHRQIAFIISTAPIIEGRPVIQQLGVQHAELVLGLGLSNNIGAGLTDFLGVEDSGLARKLSEAKERALLELKKKCLALGANACISVDFDLMTLGGNIIVASASGTAVILAEEESI